MGNAWGATEINDGGGYFEAREYSQTTPVQAFNMDTKADDGKPGTGKIVSIYVAQNGGSFNVWNPPQVNPSGWGGNSCNQTATDYDLNNESGLCSPSFAF